MTGRVHFYATDGDGRAYLRGEIDLLARKCVSVSVEAGAEQEITVGLGVLADGVCAAFEQAAENPKVESRNSKPVRRR